jgi:hypothetical protein
MRSTNGSIHHPHNTTKVGGTMEAKELLYGLNARTHFLGIVAGRPGTIADVSLHDLTYDDMRAIPPNQNPIVWLIWHIARCEDAVNLLAFGEEQVVDRDNWTSRMHCDRRDFGTGMTAEDVADFARTVDVQAVLDYHTAVGERTRERLKTITIEDLMSVDDDRLDRLVEEGIVIGDGLWVHEARLYAGWTAAQFLTWLAGSHNYLHLGECQAVRGQLGKSLDPRSLITANQAS